MNYLRKFTKQDSVDVQIQATGIELSLCDLECSSCHQDYPKSVTVEEDTVLWKSSKEYGLHLVVSTGKTDWIHDATLTSATVANSTSSWAGKNLDKYPELKNNVKVTVSSLGSEKLVLDDDHAAGRRGDILFLPFFVWIRDVKYDDVQEVLDIVVPKLIKSREEESKEIDIDLTKFEATFEVDPNHSYVLLCSHRTRDKRCGVTAPILKKALDTQLREVGHYRDSSDKSPGGTTVAFINHVGGHKFAANVLIYLRTGQVVWLARIRPGHADSIVDECILGGGKVWADNVRVALRFKSVEW